MQTPQIRLNDDHSIPQIGLGVWQASNEEASKAVAHALSVGYRHIDTAAIYRNESGVGEGMRSSGIARDEIFLTSKIWNDEIRAGHTDKALDESLKRLGTNYLDLILLHWPVDGRIAAWQALVEAREQGKVRSVGVSNFLPAHLDELSRESEVRPVLNQIEHHPWLTQPAIKDACRKLGIIVEAWSPLMQGRFDEAPEIGEIARRIGRTPAQVTLRWALQKGIVVIPKSVTPKRIEENLAIMDFELDEPSMQAIDALDRDERLGADPANFNF